MLIYTLMLMKPLEWLLPLSTSTFPEFLRFYARVLQHSLDFDVSNLSSYLFP